MPAIIASRSSALISALRRYRRHPAPVPADQCHPQRRHRRCCPPEAASMGHQAQIRTATAASLDSISKITVLIGGQPGQEQGSWFQRIAGQRAGNEFAGWDRHRPSAARDRVGQHGCNRRIIIRQHHRLAAGRRFRFRAPAFADAR